MATVTLPLREEHRDLLPHIEMIGELADRIGELSHAELRRQAAEVQAFLQHHLIPHAVAEDQVLYPMVGQLLGAPEATATMSRDHVEVVRLTDRLGQILKGLTEAPSADDERALRRVLYGLSALVGLHFVKEEEIYLPLLDERLSEKQARELFAAMEAAAGEVKEHLH